MPHRSRGDKIKNMEGDIFSVENLREEIVNGQVIRILATLVRENKQIDVEISTTNTGKLVAFTRKRSLLRLFSPETGDELSELEDKVLLYDSCPESL